MAQVNVSGGDDGDGDDESGYIQVSGKLVVTRRPFVY